MTSISFCQIVKNEEKDLPKCLASIKDVVDEIIVLDTGSSDRTVEIAKDFGAQVYYFQWCNDFAIARNEALQYVTKDWILVLDADEVLNPQIVPQIQQAIAADNHLVVNLIRQEIGSLDSPYSLVSRLFRRHPEICFDRPYHAIIDDRVLSLCAKESHWQIVNLTDTAIWHYGYTPAAISSLNKYERAKQAMEAYLSLNPNDAYDCNKLGALYLQIGQVKQGIKLLKKGLKSNRAEIPVLFELHYHLGNAYFRQGETELAAKHYQKALGLPVLPQLKIAAYNNFGGLLKEMGNLALAKQAYEKTLAIDPNFIEGHNNLGMTFRAMGRYKEALSCYHQAISLAPNRPDLYQNLGVAWLKAGYVQESLGAFKKAIQLHQKSDPQEAQRLRQNLQEMGFPLE